MLNLIDKFKNRWRDDQTALLIEILGHVFFVFYISFALIFFKERTLFVDSADFVLELIQNKKFAYALDRHSSIITQAMPLLAIKAGASLSFILKTYSFSIAFFYYLIYLLIVYVLKDKRVVLVYLLTICLFYRSSFYFGIAEIPQALALVVLLYGLIKNLIEKDSKQRILKMILAMVIILALYYFHQLLIFAIVFLLGALIIAKKAYTNRYLVGLMIISVSWFGVKIFLLSSTSYEGKKIPGIEFFIEQLPNLFSFYSFGQFLDYLKEEVWLPFLILLFSLIRLLFKRKFLLLLFFSSYIIGYLVLILITYSTGEAPHMLELYYIFFGFFLAIILDLVFDKIITLKHLFVLVLPLLLFSMFRLYLAHEGPSKRIFYTQKIIEKGREFKNRKFIMDRAYNHELGVTWAMPMESILLSSLEGKENTVTCYVPFKDEVIDLNLKDGQLLGPSWIRHSFTAKNLDSNYFLLPEKTNYLTLNSKKQE